MGGASASLLSTHGFRLRGERANFQREGPKTPLNASTKLSVYPLNNVDSQETVSHDVDTVVGLPRTKQDGSRRHKLGLHVFAQLHEQWLLEVTKCSVAEGEKGGAPIN